jgi:hypothetical protein
MAAANVPGLLYFTYHQQLLVPEAVEAWQHILCAWYAATSAALWQLLLYLDQLYFTYHQQLLVPESAEAWQQILCPWYAAPAAASGQLIMYLACCTFHLINSY